MAPNHLLTAEEREKRKSRQEQAEDIAYTLNHAVVCTLTDFIDPVIGSWTQKHLGKKLGLGHSHGHDHHGHDHGHGGGIKTWVVGEFIGDFGAVPLTIAAQRLFPGAMDGIRNVLEVPLSPLFRMGAHRSAVAWATEHHLAVDGPEAKRKEHELYTKEVGHLPQTFMWTVSAIGLNIASQKYLLGNHDSWGNLLAAKGIGSAVTAALVVGTRSTIPAGAEKLDKFTSKHLINPVTGFVSGLFGVDAEGLARAEARLGSDPHMHGAQPNAAIHANDATAEKVGAAPPGRHP